MPGNIINLTPADIAKWPTPNYIDPHRRQWMPEYASLLYGVATLMVVTRLWLRGKKHAGGFGLDDVSVKRYRLRHNPNRGYSFSSSVPG